MEREEEGEEAMDRLQEASLDQEAGMGLREAVTDREEGSEEGHHLRGGMAEGEEAMDHHPAVWPCVGRRDHRLRAT